MPGEALTHKMAPGGVQISEVKGNARENRTATHSHIKGLGLSADGTASSNAGGFIGQTAAREVPVFLALLRTLGH